MLCHLPRVRPVRSSMIEYGFAILLLALVLVLAACGQVTTVEVGSPSSTATSTALAQNGTPAANGCPAKQVPADGATFSPDVTVTQDATSPQPIALSRGQRLEIRLDPQTQWKLSATDPNGALSVQPPEGWYDASLHACIWRFAARNPGSAHLLLSGLVTCEPHPPCTAAVDTIEFDVTVR
jgi:hypothetical protein